MISSRKLRINLFLLFESGLWALLDPEQQMRVEFHTDLSVLQVKTTQ